MRRNRASDVSVRRALQSKILHARPLPLEFSAGSRGVSSALEVISVSEGAGVETIARLRVDPRPMELS